MDDNDHAMTGTRNERRKLLALYFTATALLYADQNVLAPNLTAIAEEFNLDDHERDQKLGGTISLAFFLCGAPASLLTGYIIDRYVGFRRSLLFAIVMFVGEGACLASYFVRNYRELLICRALTGFSAGGAIPIVYSVLGDVYSRFERSKVAAVVSCSVGLGVALGQGVAGFIGSKFGWRISFVIVAVPALMCASVIAFVPDPVRGLMECLDDDMNESEKINHLECEPRKNYVMMNNNEGAEILRNQTDSTSIRQPLVANVDRNLRNTFHNIAEFDKYSATDDITDDSSLETQMLNSDDGVSEDGSSSTPQSLFDESHFLRPHSVKLLLAQGIFGCLPWGVVNTYLNDYLSEDRDMSIEVATSILLLFGIGLFIGVIFGGVFGSYVYHKSPAFPPILAGICNNVGCIPMFYIINYANASSSLFLTSFMSIFAGVMMAVTGPIVKSTLTNVTLPTNRGRAFSSLNIFDELGRGIGPMIVSIIITKLGRRNAFNFSLLGWIVSGFLNSFVSCFARQDELRVQNASRLRKDSLIQHI